VAAFWQPATDSSRTRRREHRVGPGIDSSKAEKDIQFQSGSRKLAAVEASTNPSSPSLELRNVSRSLPSGRVQLSILRDISLQIPKGQFAAILGPSGSGKSTLLGLMAGLDRPTSGEILIDGVPIQDLEEDGLALLRRRKIGFVFQSFQLLPNLTATENVLLPLELLGISDAEARAAELLSAVGLGQRGHHYPVQLSGGEQQRVALARAFGPKPSILLADEPTGNLDSGTGEAVLGLLQNLWKESGTTLVLVTHDHELAIRAERRIHLRDGQVSLDEVNR
jgi:putative ABC transport system ATP-binding protein